ncbi:hypothetical protein Daura_16840 [Dactylosporangium aurantiacum]|uniref:Uncharacterized protein n=1 Tax=Dactylosporangium aurantiacum TaxID=35754 RepID=A0A9Q9IPK1_9ACTN|nr:hypothetical protein [Dactylosporangium aurantiacum]MDG6103172.1 hypothetical protein [Dactylosporangium aurantiacum]UWZ57680.1 hypothetical protein Daura_16840 [Dactylosporangium aurantiacum]
MNWDTVYGCDGTSGHVPALLRALAGPDPAPEAYSALFGHLYHQGARWQASAVVVPFLVDLVDDPATPDRAALAGMLAAVAVGDHRDDQLPFDVDAAYPDAGAITDEQVRQLNLFLAGEWPDDDPAEEFFWDRSGPDRWARDAYLALAARAATVTGWVGDADAGLAAVAAALLAWLPPAPDAVAALLAVPAGPARASANLTLAHLPAGGGRVDARLRALLDDPDARVALTAAIALAYRHGPATPEPALTMLAEAADHDRPLPADVPGWDFRALRGFVALALTRIGW